MTKAAISADSHLTAAAGARIARQGGNAVDIAVAAALASTVSEVLMCSLGGAGFFMIRMPGEDAELIEGADAFPKTDASPPDDPMAWRNVHLPYGDGVDTMAGYASIAVPGLLAAAESSWKRHGQLPWAKIVAPALELASETIPASPTMAGWVDLVGPNMLGTQPACRACFYDGEQPLKPGQPFRIPNLDHTFRVIAEQGAETFYRGDLANIFAREVCGNGGFVSLEDLAAYQADVRQPLNISSNGFRVALNPPPAVGGAAVGFLIRYIEANWNERLSSQEKTRLHADAQLRLLGLREQDLDASQLTNATARRLLETAAGQGPGPLRSPGTTHLSVVTEDGGMVAVTMSMGYGSGIVIPELGIACGNSLGEPELNPGGFLRGEPGSRLTSNMAPTLAWHPDGRCLALGSPGASRITTSIAQTWLNLVLDGMSYEEAVAKPRLHVESCSGEIRAQFEPGVDIGLLGDPLVLRPFDAFNRYFGGVKLVARDRQAQLHAVADFRRDGAVELVE